MYQSGLTIITEIIPGQEASLKKLLNEIGNDIKDNSRIKFPSLRTVHFMRFVVLDASKAHGVSTPPQLVLSTNFDRPVQAHLLELASEANEGIKAIYGHCKGFSDQMTPPEIAQYLKKHNYKSAAFYQGASGRSVGQVEEENELYHAIQDHLQTQHPSQDWTGKTAKSIRTEIRDLILGQSQFDWVKTSYRKTFLQKYGGYVLLLQVFTVLTLYVLFWIFSWKICLLLSSVFILSLLIFWISLRSLEKKDAANFKPAIKSVKQVSELNQREDYKVQNQLTHLVEIKPGLTRQIAVRVVLGAINLLAKYIFNKGNLGGIYTIHFARWVIIDKGKRLLFFSNYDGSWESYLGEFVDRSSFGLTGVWCNTVGFPPTRDLILEGARHSVEFKSWSREKQIETQIWYSAHKSLSVKNINNNTEIRQGIIGEMNEEEATKWLKKL